MPKLKYWIIAAHPWSFPASGSPALIAISYVFYMYKTGVVTDVNWTNGVIAFFGAIIFHMAGNLIGDYQDYKSGVDQLEKTGPFRVLVHKIFKPRTILIYGYMVLLIGIAIGAYLFLQTGAPLLYIGLFGIISATLYYKFKYVALGDVIIFLSFSLMVVLGIVYVMTGNLDWWSLLIASPVGLLIVAILHANNTRDMLQDKKAGIKTQAMNLGLEGSQVVYQTLLLATYLLVAFIVLFNLLHPLVFIVILTMPIALKNIKLMKQATIEDLGVIRFLDTDTAKLVLVFSLLFAAANFIAPYI